MPGLLGRFLCIDPSLPDGRPSGVLSYHPWRNVQAARSALVEVEIEDPRYLRGFSREKGQFRPIRASAVSYNGSLKLSRRPSRPIADRRTIAPPMHQCRALVPKAVRAEPSRWLLLAAP